MLNQSEKAATYVDSATMRRSEDGVRMWILRDFSKMQVLSDTRFLSIVELHEYDCKERKMRVLHSTAYENHMGKGSPSFTSPNTPWEWRYTVPGSISDAEMDIVCQNPPG